MVKKEHESISVPRYYVLKLLPCYLQVFYMFKCLFLKNLFLSYIFVYFLFLSVKDSATECFVIFVISHSKQVSNNSW